MNTITPSRLVMAGLVLTFFLSVAQATDIKIGVAEALTGPASQYGIPIRNGFELAAEEINAGGGIHGTPIQLVMEDERGKKEEAINVYKKFAFRDKVLMIFGPTLSNSMFAAGPIANAAHLVAFGTSNTATGITDMGPYIFRSSPMESDVVPITLKAAVRYFHIRTAGIIYGNDDAFTKSGYDVFRKALEDRHVIITGTETYSRGDVDFKPQLTKLMSTHPDAIVCPCLSEEGANIMLQARSLGMAQPFIGGNGFNSPQLIQNAGKASEGTIVGSPWFSDNPSPENQHFISAYRKKYGTSPNQFAAQSYDALYIVADTLNHISLTGNLNSDRQSFRDALPKTTHVGATGKFSFRPAHGSEGKPAGYDADQTPFVYVIKNGQFTLLK